MKKFSRKGCLIALGVLSAMLIGVIDFCLPNYPRQALERMWLFVAVPIHRFNLSWDTFNPYKAASVIFQIPNGSQIIDISRISVTSQENNDTCDLMSFKESQNLRSMGDHWSDRFAWTMPGDGSGLPGEYVAGSVLRNHYRVVGGVRGVETVTLEPTMETEWKTCQAMNLEWCGYDGHEASGKLITIGGGNMNCVTASDWPEIVATWDFVLDKATSAPMEQVDEIKDGVE